jgi:hypothetical protein
MFLILIQAIVQSVSSTLHWIGLYVGIRASSVRRSQQRRWIIGSAVILAAWLLGIMLLASDNFFRNRVLPPRIPTALLVTLLVGYLFLLSEAFRGIVAAIPQHWLIGIQTFRILGGVFLIRYFQGDSPALFAIPAGVGDVLTGIFALLVAYWWYAGKPYARGAAIAWNLFGMADLVNAVALGTLTGAAGIVFPIVLIPVYAVPRGFLIHSYSSAADTMVGVWVVRRAGSIWHTGAQGPQPDGVSGLAAGYFVGLLIHLMRAYRMSRAAVAPSDHTL